MADQDDAEHSIHEAPRSVAFVSSYGGSGGSELYLEALLGRLGPSWVDRVILLGNGPLEGHLRHLGLEVEMAPTLGRVHSMFRSSWRLRRRLLASRPDVVHANGLKAALVAVPATLGTKLPVLWVRHDFSMEGWRACMLARGCRGVICVSEALAQTFRGRLLRKVRIVHTGIPDMDIDRGSARRILLDLIGDLHVGPVITLVSQLVPGKGHAEMIEIAPRLLERLPDAQILFIGGMPTERFAPYVHGLKGRIEELGLDQAVTFLGHRDDALTLIAGSDMVVMPSVTSDPMIETEGFPLLALEALAVGTPLVAYKVGGIPELAGDCGSLVPPRDRQGLLQAIERVATDASLRERLTECGRRRARERFSVSDMMAGLQDAYRLAARG
jgi:glycosyltransferase involved in cell wall biosynthesis